MKLFAPDGSRIIGTVDRINAVANISGAKRNPDGSLDLDYTGDTDIDWDSQVTIARNNPDTGKRELVFVDEDGAEWLESELEFELVDEEER